MPKEEKVAKPVQAVAKPAKKAPTAKPKLRAATQTKGVSKKLNPKTVRGKIAVYQKTSAEFQSAAHQMLHLGARNMQAGVRAIQSGIKAMQSGIKEQTNKFTDGAIALQNGVAAILSDVSAMQSSIVDQVKENQEYIKNFYG